MQTEKQQQNPKTKQPKKELCWKVGYQERDTKDILQ